MQCIGCQWAMARVIRRKVVKVTKPRDNARTGVHTEKSRIWTGIKFLGNEEEKWGLN